MRVHCLCGDILVESRDAIFRHPRETGARKSGNTVDMGKVVVATADGQVICFG
jgi:hypothetical protein